jgi:hypothetical protein
VKRRAITRTGSGQALERAGTIALPLVNGGHTPPESWQHSRPFAISNGATIAARQNDFPDVRLTSGALRGLASWRPEPHVLEAQPSGKVSHGESSRTIRDQLASEARRIP